MTLPAPPPSDRELDALVASRLRRTSPEFELRWRELRASFVHPRTTPLSRWGRWLVWPGLATATLAVVAIVLTVRAPRSRTAAHPSGSFDELFFLDAALAPASALLNLEMRDAVLHLPTQKNP